ncbi:FixH family protein [Comamonas composti]|uniref:FixH family protein n=1 Tax=Comamonas composti TaxID=408558 RepID=UPI00047A1AD3|nr:FixH family protein [Comamonas composti]
MSSTPAEAPLASATAAHPEASKPWWKFGHVWLVLAGPAIVVVAGVVTAMIAMHDADPVIDPDYYKNGVEINERLNDAQKSLAPAVTGRNHAMTPAEDHPVDR